MKIPCKDCITLAICKYRGFFNLLSNCPEVHNMLYLTEEERYQNAKVENYRREDFSETIKDLFLTLKPDRWKVESHVECNNKTRVSVIIPVDKIREGDLNWRKNMKK